MMTLLRKWLILTHRYAGIVLSLFVVSGSPRASP
jgi:hypothetical protein